MSLQEPFFIWPQMKGSLSELLTEGKQSRRPVKSPNEAHILGLSSKLGQILVPVSYCLGSRCKDIICILVTLENRPSIFLRDIVNCLDLMHVLVKHVESCGSAVSNLANAGPALSLHSLSLDRAGRSEQTGNPERPGG